MISADMDAINAHSFVCMPVKCRQCGLMISANIDAIEAHSAVCLGTVDASAITYPNSRLHATHDTTGQCHEKQFMPLSMPLANDEVLGRALLNLSNANLAHLSQDLQQGNSGMPFVPMHMAEEALQKNELFLEQLRMEVKCQIEAIRAQQMAAATQSPVQIVVENCSSVRADQTLQHQESQPLPVANTELWWQKFLASPANRFVIFTTVQLSLYFAHGYLSHRYRLSELQHRIDANAFLRFQQILNSQLKVLL